MRLGATEDWSPGIPGLTVNLYEALPDPENPGDYIKGDLLQTAETEAWTRPEFCVARDGDGESLGDGVSGIERAWPQERNPAVYQDDCIESAMMGTQFGPIAFDADGVQVPLGDPDMDDFNASLDGNYGFGDLLPGKYLVEVDAGSIVDINGDPVYRTQLETDINVFGGDVYTPQNAAGDPTAGGVGSADPEGAVGRRPVDNSATYGVGSTARCMGEQFVVDLAGQLPDGAGAVENPSFLDAGGTPFEGETLRRCDVKLVELTDRRSVAPVFNFVTESGVPLPARYRGYMANDLAIGTDPASTMYGEVPGIGQTPVGVYDWRGRQITVKDTDPNGHFEFLLPSTITGNCPTPSGVCPGMFRFVGNDPGVPGRRNPNYNPQFRTIAAHFQAWPGMTALADTAPTQVAANVLSPGGVLDIQKLCAASPVEPVVFTVDTATLLPDGPDAGTAPDPAPHVGPVVPRDGGNSPVGIGNARRTLTITGDHFGATPGTGSVKLYDSADNTIATLAILSWSDDVIVARVPILPDATPSGTAPFYSTSVNSLSLRLEVQRGSGERSLNAVTVHVLRTGTPGPGSTPRVVTVGPAGGPVESFEPIANPATVTDALVGPTGLYPAEAGDWPDIQAYLAARPIQRALDDAAGNPANDEIVVVYPNTPTGYDPTQVNVDGAWYDNPAMFSPVKLQGIGSGGVQIQGATPTGTALQVLGSTLDGSAFWGTPANGAPAPAEVFTAFMLGIPMFTPGEASVGQVVYAAAPFVADADTPADQVPDDYTAAFEASVDGFTITGGNQQGFPGNVNRFTGNPLPIAGGEGGSDALATPDPVKVQGGAVFVDAWAEFFQITNNNIVSNGGTYGAIRAGNPWVAYFNPDNPTPDPDNHLDGLRIDHNQIVANGGSQIGGAISIFTGADSYRVSSNNLCGNFSTTYGGALTHFGQSDNGSIERNAILYNQSYDEGGGVMIAGEPALIPGQPSAGSGTVSIRQNLFSANLANDDGGALRFLEAGNHPITVVNNFITNNVSTHEGAGIAIDKATQVRIVNNTIARNVTTATAATSDGLPAPAGLSTTLGSVPFMFNNIFDENYAGNWNSSTATVEGIDFTAPAATRNRWDMGAIDLSPPLTPTSSMLDTPNGTSGSPPDVVASPTNIVNGNPDFVDLTLPETRVSVHTFRSFPSLRSAAIVATDFTEMPGDYHIGLASQATDAGAASKLLPPPAPAGAPAPALPAPVDDYDCRYLPTIVCRPVDGPDPGTLASWDIGADERAGTVAFAPTATALDDFTRGTGTGQVSVNTTALPVPPGAVGAPPPNYWIGLVGTTGNFGITGAVPPCTTGNRCLRINGGTGSRIWNRGTFGSAQELSFTWRTPNTASSATVGMVLRANGVSLSGDPLPPESSSSYVSVEYRPGTATTVAVLVKTQNVGQNPVTLTCALGSTAAAMTAGDVLLARVSVSGGDLQVWRMRGTTWSLLCTKDLVAEGFVPATGGQVGLISSGTASVTGLDNFAGGTIL